MSDGDRDDNPSSPLLGNTSNRPTSKQSNRSNHSNESTEQTPLLSRSDSATRYDGEEDRTADRLSSPATASLQSLQNGNGSTKSYQDRRRWPTVLAVSLLGLIVIVIILGAFFAPAAVEEYAKQALAIEPTNLSIDSFTKTGVRARLQANFKMDASRVENQNVRNIGRLGTWIVREVESEASTVEVYLPEYGNVLVGIATVPKIVVDIRNGHITPIDFLSDLQPGDIEGIRQVANDWLDGRLDKIRLLGKANVALKSGLISLGSQSITQSLVFEGNDVPAIPEYNITRMNFREVVIPPSGRRGMAADVSISVVNSYPVKLEIPPLGFDILVPNCAGNDHQIRLADATTAAVDVEPYSEVLVQVGGIVRKLPDSFTETCPDSHKSPLDSLLGSYMHGEDTTIYVRGSNAPDSATPGWISKIMSSVTVPVPFPGHTFDGLIQNFSLTDSKFGLPDPFADPGSDGANPQISANIVVIAGLPDEMNFGLNVSRVRANADVYYKERKLGVLDLRKWQAAESERITPKKGEKNTLKIQSRIENAPLNITDDDVFTDVIQAMLFGEKQVMLKVDASVDVEVETVLGKLVIKDLPAEGNVPVKPISTGKGFDSLKPSVYGLKVLSTTQTALNLEARVNFTNPTEYTAHVPYLNIHILSNCSVIGDATIRNLSVGRGNNTNLLVQATWDPATLGGQNATIIAKELLSQYISGFNTTLTFQTHNGSFPFRPDIGETLSKFAITIPTPRLSTPAPGGDDDDGDDDKPHFIKDATFHLFSSTATFTLVSPLKYSTIYIDSIKATALYNHTEPIGTINYDLPFKVPPGVSTSPRIPVDWSLGSVGYEEMKKALGGTLKLDAKGEVAIRLDRWTQTVWYVGSGIGAGVTFL